MLKLMIILIVYLKLKLQKITITEIQIVKAETWLYVQIKNTFDKEIHHLIIDYTHIIIMKADKLKNPKIIVAAHMYDSKVCALEIMTISNHFEEGYILLIELIARYSTYELFKKKIGMQRYIYQQIIRRAEIMNISKWKQQSFSEKALKKNGQGKLPIFSLVHVWHTLVTTHVIRD
ncbi:hypothetical protein ACJX0J_039410 [Zea mays]